MPNSTMLVPTISAVTASDSASLVRNKPCTIHGCRPTSTEIHPSWLPRYAGTTAAMNTGSSQRACASRPAAHSPLPTVVKAKKNMPMVNIAWYVWNTSPTFGQSSFGVSANPGIGAAGSMCTSIDSPPGTAMPYRTTCASTSGTPNSHSGAGSVWK